MWVYIMSEKPNADNDYHTLYTVGFYAPAIGDERPRFVTDSDHSDKDSAAARVSYLNGGDDPRKPFPTETF